MGIKKDKLLDKKNKLSLNQWANIATIGALIIAVLAWVFPSPISYFKDDNSTVKQIKKTNIDANIKINLNGRVFENKSPQYIPIAKVRVKLFINDIYLDKKDTYTNRDGNFSIKNIRFSDKIKLCYEKKNYQKDYCLSYQKDEYVYLPKK